MKINIMTVCPKWTVEDLVLLTVVWGGAHLVPPRPLPHFAQEPLILLLTGKYCH